MISYVLTAKIITNQRLSASVENDAIYPLFYNRTINNNNRTLNRSFNKFGK